MMNRITQLILLSCCLCSPAGWATGDWEPAKDEDGIRVYTREVDGWDIEEFKVITILNVKRYVVYETLIDIANYKSWYPDVLFSEVTKVVSDKEFYCYSQLDIPWPSDDRDGEAHVVVTHNKEEKTTLISLTACEKYKSRQDGFIRMTKGKGFWKLTSKGEQTVVHYQYLSDPGGSIPSWIINLFIVDNPFNTMKALKDRVKG